MNYAKATMRRFAMPNEETETYFRKHFNIKLVSNKKKAT